MKQKCSACNYVQTSKLTSQKSVTKTITDYKRLHFLREKLSKENKNWLKMKCSITQVNTHSLHNSRNARTKEENKEERKKKACDVM